MPIHHTQRQSVENHHSPDLPKVEGIDTSVHQSIPLTSILDSLCPSSDVSIPISNDSPPPRRSDVDWSLIVRLRSQASERISENTARWFAEKHSPMPADDRRLMGRSIINSTVREYAHSLSEKGEASWSLNLEKAHAKALEDSIFGYGRLQPLFEIADAENIEINGWDHVTIQYGDGRRISHSPVADSDEELIEAVRFLASTVDPPRAFDDAHPMMTIALGKRYRLHAVAFGLTHRPSIVIRQHLLTDICLADLAHNAMMPSEVADFLDLCVKARKSIVISGDQGAGKTTLLRALISSIPSSERIGTLETDYELLTHLLPGRGNVVAFQSKVGMGEVRNGHLVGEYTVADLIPEALRQNLSRLIVGEVRGLEAGAMFEAMQAGAGTMSTTHSHSASSTMDRLASRVARGSAMSIEEAYRQIALNMHLLIHVSLKDETWRGGQRVRFISEIHELTGAMENGRPVTHRAYISNPDGSAGLLRPSAAFMDDLSYVRRS